MVLCKRSRLIIIFPSTYEGYTHVGWFLTVETVLFSTLTQCDVAATCFNYWLHAGGRQQSTFTAESFWSKGLHTLKVLITIIDCCVCENKNGKKFNNRIFDYRLTSLVQTKSSWPFHICYFVSNRLMFFLYTVLCSVWHCNRPSVLLHCVSTQRLVFCVCVGSVPHHLW